MIFMLFSFSNVVMSTVHRLAARRICVKIFPSFYTSFTMAKSPPAGLRYGCSRNYFFATNGESSRRRFMISGIFCATKSISSCVLYLLRLKRIEP